MLHTIPAPVLVGSAFFAICAFGPHSIYEYLPIDLGDPNKILAALQNASIKAAQEAAEIAAAQREAIRINERKDRRAAAANGAAQVIAETATQVISDAVVEEVKVGTIINREKVIEIVEIGPGIFGPVA